MRSPLLRRVLTGGMDGAKPRTSVRFGGAAAAVEPEIGRSNSSPASYAMARHSKAKEHGAKRASVNAAAIPMKQ